MSIVDKPEQSRCNPDETGLFCHWCDEEVHRLIQLAPGLWVCPDCHKKLTETGDD